MIFLFATSALVSLQPVTILVHYLAIVLQIAFTMYMSGQEFVNCALVILYGGSILIFFIIYIMFYTENWNPDFNSFGIKQGTKNILGVVTVILILIVLVNVLSMVT